MGAPANNKKGLSVLLFTLKRAEGIRGNPQGAPDLKLPRDIVSGCPRFINYTGKLTTSCPQKLKSLNLFVCFTRRSPPDKYRPSQLAQYPRKRLSENPPSLGKGRGRVLKIAFAQRIPYHIGKHRAGYILHPVQKFVLQRRFSKNFFICCTFACNFRRFREYK